MIDFLFVLLSSETRCNLPQAQSCTFFCRDPSRKPAAESGRPQLNLKTSDPVTRRAPAPWLEPVSFGRDRSRAAQLPGRLFACA
eukprot:scaffold7660_cov200-Pinguiococcus_pyrenoidosus.AAC.1